MNSKGICLISGGIDSPVAAYLMSKKIEIIPLHFLMYPFSSEESTSITLKALKRLQKKTNFNKMGIFPLGNVLKHIFQKLNNKRYTCIFCRKAMFKTASKICDRLGASSIITGESLGQKASQTLDNLRTTSFNIKYPIHRPLIGMDKDNIIKKSKDLNLFSKKHAGCCNATPEKPRTQSKPIWVDDEYKKMKLDDKIEGEMKKLELLDAQKIDITKMNGKF
ncbi:MAG: hypothetical protein ABEK17_00870 [Candidatus Aenigmatarchaeota archaeon]